MKYSAILLAAGKGTRYKGTKQDVLFHNKPLWRYAYETGLKVVGENNIVAVGKGTTTITATTVNNKSATCIVIVNLPIESVTLNKQEYMFLAKGYLSLMFNGNLNIQFGKNNVLLKSDGTDIIDLSSYFLDEEPFMTIKSVGTTEMLMFNLKLSKC